MKNIDNKNCDRVAGTRKKEKKNTQTAGKRVCNVYIGIKVILVIK